METPRLEDVIAAAVKSFLGAVEVAMPVRVVKYNAARETVDVQPQIRHSLDNGDGTFDEMDYPVIPDVPIAWLSGKGGSCFFTMPFGKGDPGFVICASKDIGMWRSTGQQGTSGDQRRHTIAGAIFIPGLRPNGELVGSGKRDSEAVVIGEKVMLGASGLDPAQTGALNGEAIDPYTGLSHWQLGNASQSIFVKKT